MSAIDFSLQELLWKAVRTQRELSKTGEKGEDLNPE